MPDAVETAGFPNLIIRASAGTGKTFQLSNRYLGILARGGRADRILATTFTRKAAGEILDRVVLRLAEAINQPELRLELGKLLGQELSQAALLELCQRLLAELHRLRICTIDSFFTQAARGLSLELGVSPAWRILDDLEDVLLRDQALEIVLAKGGTQELLTLMHLLTKGDTDRGIADVLRSTVRDLYGLFQETDQAAWSGLARPEPLPPADLAAAIQELESLEMPDKRFTSARDADCEKARRQDWKAFIAAGLAAKLASGVGEFYAKPIPEAVAAAYEPLLRHARAILVGKVALQTEGSYEVLRAFDEEYRLLKQQRGVLRFEDITRQIGRANDQANGGQMSLDRLTYRLDGQLEHLLLDEFQDTSPAQWRAMRPVAEHTIQPNPKCSFFCVGDVKQAIYGWRGGVAEIFDAISQQLTDVEVSELNRSFRSSPVIIDLVNRVFAAIPTHPNLDRLKHPVVKWCERFRPHETQRNELAGFVTLQTAARGDDPTKTRKLALEESADLVERLVAQSARHRIGVLVRRNEAASQMIGLLRRRGVHASEEGGNPLVDAVSVQVLMSLLRTIDHPGDRIARFHVAHSPLAKLLDWRDWQDDDDAHRQSQLLRRQLMERGYGESIAQWAQPLMTVADRRETGRLTQLVELAYLYQQRATQRADDFVFYIERHKVATPRTAQVRVMTIHQAKGLEFDVVVLPELDAALAGQPDSFVVERRDPTQPVRRVCRYANTSLQNLLPRSVQKMFVEADDRTVTESLCVLYVALTRAAHALHIIVPPSSRNEKRMPRTLAGLLRHALAPDSEALPEEILFQLGDPEWFQHAGDPVDRRAADSPPLPSRIQLKTLCRASPSRTGASQPLRPGGRNSRQAVATTARRGLTGPFAWGDRARVVRADYLARPAATDGPRTAPHRPAHAVTRTGGQPATRGVDRRLPGNAGPDCCKCRDQAPGVRPLRGRHQIRSQRRSPS